MGNVAQADLDALTTAITAAKAVQAAATKTQAELDAAKSTLDGAITAFNATVITSLTFSNVQIIGTEPYSTNPVTLGLGETLTITSSDATNAVVTVTEDPSGTIKVTRVAVGGPITITVQVIKDSKVIKTGTFIVTVTD